MNTALEQYDVLSVQLAIYELSSMADVCWDRKERNIGIVECLGVVNLVRQAFVSTAEDDSHINFL